MPGPAIAAGTESPILVSPIHRDAPDGDLIVTARIHESGSVADVTLWALAREHDRYRALPMEPTGDGRFQTRLAVGDGTEWLAYYVEASGRDGARWSNGNAGSPFIVDLETISQAAVAQPERGSPAWGLVALFGLPLLSSYLLLRRRPTVVIVRFGRAVDKARANKSGAGASRDSPRSARIESDRRARANAERREVELFWFDLLEPLLVLNQANTELVLKQLARRCHNHPVDGRRMFSEDTLRERLLYVKRMHRSDSPPSMPPAPVKPTGRSVPVPRSAGAHRSAGASMVEVVAVLALIAIAVAIGVPQLRPVETPLEIGGETLAAMVEQTRARAVATTRPHRIRPISPEKLVVEHASSCSAGAWTYDSRIELELPERVTLDAQNWSVCFNRRGLSSENLVIVLSHPDRGSRSLEVLKGGMTRWVP